tara:strand:- start:548 stop:802 length:255 start_codon:yes stop_codon:yes gene_type:complete
MEAAIKDYNFQASSGIATTVTGICGAWHDWPVDMLGNVQKPSHGNKLKEKLLKDGAATRTQEARKIKTDIKKHHELKEQALVET